MHPTWIFRSRAAINTSLLKQDIVAVRMGGKRQKGVENKVLCNILSGLNLFVVNTTNGYMYTLRALGVMVHGKGRG